MKKNNIPLFDAKILKNGVWSAKIIARLLVLEKNPFYSNKTENLDNYTEKSETFHKWLIVLQ